MERSDAVCEAGDAADQGVDLRPARGLRAVDLDQYMECADCGAVEKGVVGDVLAPGVDEEGRDRLECAVQGVVDDVARDRTAAPNEI